MPPRALLATPLLLAALTVPAHAAREAATQTIGCPGYGYSMRIPVSWKATGGCSAKVKASNGNGLVLTVIVEKHGYWNDDRSRASIQGDARTLGTITTAPAFQPVVIGGHTFLASTVQVAGTGGKALVFAEMETYAGGRLYKFAAIVTNLAGTGSVATMGTIWETIAIAAPPPPPSTEATSPDAPGVVVTAKGLHVDSGGDYPPPAGQQYVVTRITVANNGTSNYNANPFDFSVVDGGDGVSHSYGFDMGIGNSQLSATTLAPGQSVTGDVAFEIPSAETSVRLYWEPTFLSPKVYIHAS